MQTNQIETARKH